MYIHIKALPKSMNTCVCVCFRVHVIRSGASVCRVGPFLRHTPLPDHAGPPGAEQSQLGGLMQEPSTSSEEAEPSPAATATPSQPTAASTELNVTTVADKSNSKEIPQGSRES